MSDWQERITHDTPPAIRVEHELRYRIVAPLVRSAGAWADLGCGNGLAAAAALGADRPTHTLLVDLDAASIERAAHELGLPRTSGIAGDLTDPQVLIQIGARLHELPGDRVVSCFEVVEHLSSFLPLLEWSEEMASTQETTFVLSVPNDAFWSIQNPHHMTAWGEGAFEQLRQLLPAEHTLLVQVALSGSAVVGWDAEARTHELRTQVGGENTVATHFIAAFGPRHRDLERGALVVQTPMGEQRRWERERESDLAIAQHDIAVAQDDVLMAQRETNEHRAALREQDATIAEQQEKLRAQTAEFDAWRAYIHELEGELGRPLSGSDEQGIPPR